MGQSPVSGIGEEHALTADQLRAGQSVCRATAALGGSLADEWATEVRVARWRPTSKKNDAGSANAPLNLRVDPFRNRVLRVSMN